MAVVLCGFCATTPKSALLITGNIPYFYGAPDRIRTYGLCLRRAALYPAELRVPWGGSYGKAKRSAIANPACRSVLCDGVSSAPAPMTHVFFEPCGDGSRGATRAGSLDLRSRRRDLCCLIAAPPPSPNRGSRDRTLVYIKPCRRANLPVPRAAPTSAAVATAPRPRLPRRQCRHGCLLPSRRARRGPEGAAGPPRSTGNRPRSGPRECRRP